MTIIKTHELREGSISPQQLQIYNGIEYAVINLTRGYTTLIDLEDYERVGSLKWFASVNPWQVRAARMDARSIVYLHHFVLGVTGPQLKTLNQEVDHEDRNSLHNWKANLVIKDHKGNMQNTDRHKHRIGVSFHRASGLWIAYISFPYDSRVSLGYWNTKERALEITKMGEELYKTHTTTAAFKEAWRIIRPRKPYDKRGM